MVGARSFPAPDFQPVRKSTENALHQAIGRGSHRRIHRSMNQSIVRAPHECAKSEGEWDSHSFADLAAVGPRLFGLGCAGATCVMRLRPAGAAGRLQVPTNKILLLLGTKTDYTARRQPANRRTSRAMRWTNGSSVGCSVGRTDGWTNGRADRGSQITRWPRHRRSSQPLEAIAALSETARTY